MVAAHLRTSAAAYTFMRKKRKLFGGVKSLGIVAPYTAQRTALEKNRRSYAVAVMNGEAFYFKNIGFFIDRIYTH